MSDHKKPMTRWTVHVYATKDGYVSEYFSVWASSDKHARKAIDECIKLLHTSSPDYRCSIHNCSRCVGKAIGKEIVKEHKHGSNT